MGLGMYLLIFFGLLGLTILTVLASRVDLPGWNTPIAMLIATTKAVLVILFFMHVIHSTKLTWAVIIASVFWLGLLFLLTFADYLTRAWAVY
ncbi:MAG: cytochrome C oxidase subunit IV family protein [Acidobacteria bacterium]|nr:cytochrome C oxidase subunit IV family protein [Acidobacteriota bacterium]